MRIIATKSTKQDRKIAGAFKHPPKLKGSTKPFAEGVKFPWPHRPPPDGTGQALDVTGPAECRGKLFNGNAVRNSPLDSIEAARDGLPVAGRPGEPVTEESRSHARAAPVEHAEERLRTVGREDIEVAQRLLVDDEDVFVLNRTDPLDRTERVGEGLAEVSKDVSECSLFGEPPGQMLHGLHAELAAEFRQHCCLAQWCSREGHSGKGRGQVVRGFVEQLGRLVARKLGGHGVTTSDADRSGRDVAEGGGHPVGTLDDGSELANLVGPE